MAASMYAIPREPRRAAVICRQGERGRPRATAETAANAQRPAGAGQIAQTCRGGRARASGTTSGWAAIEEFEKIRIQPQYQDHEKNVDGQGPARSSLRIPEKTAMP